jgi:hypothetical protein
MDFKLKKEKEKYFLEERKKESIINIVFFEEYFNHIPLGYNFLNLLKPFFLYNSLGREAPDILVNQKRQLIFTTKKTFGRMPMCENV